MKNNIKLKIKPTNNNNTINKANNTIFIVFDSNTLTK